MVATSLAAARRTAVGEATASWAMTARIVKEDVNLILNRKRMCVMK